jgi:steroid 5-alpha reductase family enzyme
MYTLQVGNYVFHAQLAALRASDKDTSRYSLPPGLAFRYVCCPHYTCEVLAWVAFVLIAPTRPGMYAPLLTGWLAWLHSVLGISME